MDVENYNLFVGSTTGMLKGENLFMSNLKKYIIIHISLKNLCLN